MMDFLYDYSGSFSLLNRNRAHQPKRYSQPRCQLCEDSIMIRYNMRLPGTRMLLDLCLPCLETYGTISEQPSDPDKDHDSSTLLGCGSRRIRSWMHSAYELIYGGNASGAAIDQREQRIQANLAFWKESAELLKATGRETKAEQLRNRRSLRRQLETMRSRVRLDEMKVKVAMAKGNELLCSTATSGHQ